LEEVKLNPKEILEYKKKTGSVIGFKDTKTITNKQLLQLDCDILVLAALENQITDENVNKVKAKIILELANGPVMPEADKKLFKKNVIILPDILANAGGVTVSYFEWVQNRQRYYWTEKEVLEKLRKIMKNAFNEVWEIKEKYLTDMRTAAFILALKKLSEVAKIRGGILRHYSPN